MHSDSSDVADPTPNSNIAAEPSTSDPILGDRPSQRIQIGSQRDSGVTEAKPKPVTPAGPPPVKKKEPKHYPPPNIRDQLTPEMEAEYRGSARRCVVRRPDAERRQQRGGARAAAGSARHGSRRQDHREDVFVDLGGRNQGVVPLRQFERTAGRGRRTRADRRAFRRRRRALRTCRARPPPSTSAIGTKCAKGRSSTSRSPAATRAAWNARSPASAASFRWGRFRSIASKTPRNSSASGWRAWSPKRTAIAAIWSLAIGP